jgi:hypothetical protein
MSSHADNSCQQNSTVFPYLTLTAPTASIRAPPLPMGAAHQILCGLLQNIEAFVLPVSVEVRAIFFAK